ncbi:16S rRNA (cytosine(1402)-N(4))-methyltransferase RsmH [Thiohalophilus thiocyanatoxydans]|uniref:Ribosomal RNA small subunit methyltransferase H n=1 Tax=Thiohalophilus thiocyanatoxydans TaxID=381308 RepID=A0A4R8IPN0_9GAMM|nr:16S rRNA (cytosine(1402)-N(4))-methyltransferase RsmH [Thiohalophilus thiocyanatoxydans]TDY01140.1 16S rRNA (cytosine1402-N4)-methyltransferase [Thiohalophilus thiocyanatoxydans]
MNGKQEHLPVLLEEAIRGMNIKPDGRYIDGTFGRGGHSAAILARLGDGGRLLAFDKDPRALETAQEKFSHDSRFTLVQDSFARMAPHIAEQGWEQVDGILLDLGVSSPQLDDASRGFSFQKDGPLDMRMDTSRGPTAAQWLADAGEKEIARVLKEYGEERFAKRIARAIVAARNEQPITTTKQLSAIVAAANPAWEKGKDPATRAFQAIRIYINHELDELDECLLQITDLLVPGGRLVVISFHSLEDRRIKQFMRKQSKGDDFPPDLPVMQSQLKPKMKLIGKAQRAADAEVDNNPRARSAVLRVAEKLS